MTKLEIAEKIRGKCRINGTITTVEGTISNAEHAKCIEWAEDAYRDILNLHDTWQFMREDMSKTLTSGTSEYLPSALDVTYLANWILDDWRCYLTSTTDEQEIYFWEWEHFKRSYLFGNSRSQTGRPSIFSVKPDESVVFWPEPDDTYTVTGEYYLSDVAFTDDDDEPAFPSRFHDAVVWRALYYYGHDYVEHDRLVFAERQYNRMIGDLEFDQLPRVGWGNPLC